MQVDPQGHRTSYAYDGAGRQIAVTNAENETTQSVYYADGQLQQTIDPEGHRTSYTYDAAHRQTTVTNPEEETTASVWWPSGLVRASINPEGDRTTVSFRQGCMIVREVPAIVVA